MNRLKLLFTGRLKLLKYHLTYLKPKYLPSAVSVFICCVAKDTCSVIRWSK